MRWVTDGPLALLELPPDEQAELVDYLRMAAAAYKDAARYATSQELRAKRGSVGERRHKQRREKLEHKARRCRVLAAAIDPRTDFTTFADATSRERGE